MNDDRVSKFTALVSLERDKSFLYDCNTDVWVAVWIMKLSLIIINSTLMALYVVVKVSVFVF